MNTLKVYLSDGIIVREEFFGALIFNQFNSKVLEINKTGALIINQIINGLNVYENLTTLYPNQNQNQIKEDVDHFMEFLWRNKIISNNIGTGKYIKMKWETNAKCLSAPRSIFWECTYNCNIATCIHCYSHSDAIKTAEIDGKSLIKQIADLGVFVIDIGGGEPLLREDLAELINMANSFGLRCNIATNLSLSENKIIQFVDSVSNWALNSIQISLDGHNAELHDQIRGGKGWYEKTVSNLDVLKKRNIKFRINCTVMQLNINHVEDIVKKSIDLNARTVRFIRLIPAGRGVAENLQITPEQYKKHCLELVKLRSKYKDFIDVGADDSFLFLELDKENYNKIKPRIPWIKPPYVGCGAARTLMAITADNHVLPCSYLNDKCFISGDLKTESLESIWKSSMIFNDLREQKSIGKTCDSCFFKDKCLGGCRAAIFGVYNTIEEKDPLCWNLCSQK